jgi:prepilin-type N-terminal cleavage/methylation domain-containing protein
MSSARPQSGFTPFESSFQTGFTLIEIVLSIAVASGIAMAVFSGIQLIDSIRMRQEHASTVAWEADFIVAHLRSRISGGIDAPGPQETSATLSLPDGAVIGVDDGLLTEMVSGTTVALSSSHVRISSLSFSDAGTEAYPGLLTVSFTLSTAASTSRSPYEQTYSTTFYVR